jgi:hypothetical protein
MTRDIDIVVALSRENSGAIEKLFAATYYLESEAVSDAIQRHSMFNIIHLASVIKVDFIVLSNAPFALEEFGRRRNIVVEDFQTTIISREDLILSKLAWAQDSASEMQLRDVRNLIGEGCDTDYLRKWASRLNVTEMLESFLKHHE